MTVVESPAHAPAAPPPPVVRDPRWVRPALIGLLAATAVLYLWQLGDSEWATEKASWRWLALAGVAVGFAFLAKMLQAFLVLPAFGVAYLVFARTTLAKRALHLLGALGAMVVAGGWWVAVVELVPASSRP